MRTAVITGANGQDGMLLSRWLIQQGYSVTGLVRSGDRETAKGVDKQVMANLTTDALGRLFASLHPDEIYHLAGDSFAGFPSQGATAMICSNVVQTSALLDAVADAAPEARVFLAGSAAVFGNPPVFPQDESCPRAPVSFYGSTKLMVHALAELHRSAGRFVSTGILYNHESTLRPERFVTRKITAAAARIAAGQQEKLVLGNLEVIRDWGHAEDYVRAMHLILKADEPEDWIVASGEGHTVREFCRLAFETAGLNADEHVISSEEFWRPAETVPLIGNPRKIEEKLGWRRHRSFADLVAEMTAADLEKVRIGGNLK